MGIFTVSKTLAVLKKTNPARFPIVFVVIDPDSSASAAAAGTISLVDFASCVTISAARILCHAKDVSVFFGARLKLRFGIEPKLIGCILK